MKKKNLGKKLVAAGLCMAMLGSMAGCAGSSEDAAGTQAEQTEQAGQADSGETEAEAESQEPIELTYWYWEDEEGTIENMLKDKWEAYAGDRIKVNFESVPSSSFHDKLITAISTGTGPDVFICKPMWAPEL